MKPGCRLALLAGCVLVAALFSPHSARVVVEDLLGPYASRGAAPDETAFAHAIAAEPIEHLQEMRGDADGDADHESAHDAP